MGKKKEFYALVLLGEKGVGKSALALQFVDNKYVEEHVHDYGNSDYRKRIKLDNKKEDLTIFDLPNNEDYTKKDRYTSVGRGFLIVYSVTDKASFEAVSLIRDELIRFRDRDDLPIVIVGNKIDLVTERVVSVTEGQELAQHLGCMFFEASAKDNVNIEETFFQLTRDVRRFLSTKAALSSSNKSKCVIS